MSESCFMGFNLLDYGRFLLPYNNILMISQIYQYYKVSKLNHNKLIYGSCQQVFILSDLDSTTVIAINANSSPSRGSIYDRINVSPLIDSDSYQREDVHVVWYLSYNWYCVILLHVWRKMMLTLSCITETCSNAWKLARQHAVNSIY